MGRFLLAVVLSPATRLLRDVDRTRLTGASDGPMAARHQMVASRRKECLRVREPSSGSIAQGLARCSTTHDASKGTSGHEGVSRKRWEQHRERSERDLRYRLALKARPASARRPNSGHVKRHLGQAGHDCNGRYRRHRRIQNAMFLEAGPDSESRIGNDFAKVKACGRPEKLSIEAPIIL